MSVEKCRETLLKKKKYYENCSCCKVDKLKELKQGLPIREIISLWFFAIYNCLKGSAYMQMEMHANSFG
ncbi:hypothetical protein Pint_05495 [Pistacia integerrima]|uniref:Uncharacterized protein n=1 Tax=Pistacia integerrima TaxID=434235 RepID=A0ACC0Z864_9ROSI|nr:hypothetical protein Pint_05495 [Pistacia integerrima]